jgi:hypothetical protein
MFAMRDVFGRFRYLIYVYMLSGKNCGYAKYVSKEAAEQVIQASICCLEYHHSASVLPDTRSFSKNII